VDYCALLERVESFAGGPEACAELLFQTFHHTVPELGSLRRAVLGPKALYRFVYEIINPLLLPCVAFVYEDVGPRTIRIEAWTRPGVPPCPTIFRTAYGALRGVPLHLDLPPAEVVSKVTDDYGQWEVFLPASETVAHRVSRAIRSIVLGIDDDGTELRFHLEGASDASPLERAVARWQLTPRQRQVLAVVAQGKSNKEIAQALGCAENTVELHVTQLLRRAEVKSRAELIAHFWSHD
jgi:DNA-binding CsgD family transcriptional regulator